MARNRFPFLPLFLAVTAIVFVVAVAIRARTYVTANATTTGGGKGNTVALDQNVQERHPELTGTLFPLPDGSTPSSDTKAQVSSSPAGAPLSPAARAQRLRELLSQPITASSPNAVPKPAVLQLAAQQPVHPPATPPKQSPQPSLAQRTMQPANPGPGASSNAQSNNKSGHSPGPDTPRKDPNDPTSDTKAPQLLGAEFNPPQVHDGEEGIIYITAIDDISGVRNISGTVISPSGKALQGFSCQPDGEVPDRYVGRVAIPKDAEEGVWRVNFISLSDNASNTSNLHINSGGIPSTAVLKVISSRPDNTPPTLRRVWLDRQQMKAGERNTVYLEADDDKSGVKFASGVFLSPAKIARISFGCTKGDVETQWNCAISTPIVLDCGDWQLEQVQLQDGANNTANVRLDNPIVGHVKLSILADVCDNTAPVLQSLTLDPRVVSNQDGSILITATVTDDLAGVYGVMAQAIGPGQGSSNWLPLNPGGQGSTVFTGRFNVPKNAGKGLWRISFVQVSDKGNNLRLYTQNDPPLANATFEVR